MDFFDLPGLTGTEGTRRMRILTGLVGAFVGGLIGYFIVGDIQSSPAHPVINGAVGALVGAGLGALFSAIVFLVLLAIVAGACVIAWQIYFGGA